MALLIWVVWVTKRVLSYEFFSSEFLVRSSELNQNKCPASVKRRDFYYEKSQASPTLPQNTDTTGQTDKHGFSVRIQAIRSIRVPVLISEAELPGDFTVIS